MIGWLRLAPEDPDLVRRGPFERLYGRFGSRYLTGLLVGGVLSIGALTIPVAALAIPYLDLSTGEYVSSMAIAVPWMLLVGAVAYLGVAQRLGRPLQNWLRGGKPRTEAPEAWRVAASNLQPIVVVMGSVVVLGSIPASIYVAWVADVDSGAVVGAIAVVGLCIVAGAGLHYLIFERALRPIVLELAGQLPADFQPGGRSVSLSGRLFVLVPLVSLLCAVITAGFASADFSPTGKLAVGLLVGLGVTVFVAVPLTLLFVRSVLVPLQRLLSAMGKVERGSLDSKLPLTADDEIGIVSRHFNSMLDGLNERDQLSNENRELEAQVRAQLGQVRASRARIIAASDAERRRVERNIHDGAQQRLVALALKLRMIEARADPALSAEITDASDELSEALAELRELARGLHPQILSTDGLRPALEQLAGRASVPVKVEAPSERYPDPVESTAYFVVSEALANVGKYAQASAAEVSVERRNGALHVQVADDGVGGADPDRGSGLSGLHDRVAALDGTLEVASEVRSGTRVRVTLPLGEPDA